MREFARFQRRRTWLSLALIALIWVGGTVTSIRHTILWWWPDIQGQGLTAAQMRPQTSLLTLFANLTAPRTLALIVLPIFILATANAMRPASADWLLRSSRRVNDRQQTKRLLQTVGAFMVLTALTMLLLYGLFMARITGLSGTVVVYILMTVFDAGALMLFWGIVFELSYQASGKFAISVGVTYLLSLLAYFIGTRIPTMIWLPARAFDSLLTALQQATVQNGLALFWEPLLASARLSLITLVFSLALILLKQQLVKTVDYY